MPDDGIVGDEHIALECAFHADVLDALREVGLPVLSAVATTMAAFLPLMLLEGVVGQFMFVIPFTTLLSRKAKASNTVMTIMAVLVFTGIFVERLLFLIPVANMNAIVVALALVALAAPLVVMLRQGADAEAAETV